VRQELRVPLSMAIEQARRTHVAAVSENIPVASAGQSARLAITVVPLELAGIARHFLVLFGPDCYDRNPEDAPVASWEEKKNVAALPVDQENAQLSQELKATREYLQSVIEELRSTNEEVQSANEELQSTNEELQTSREELQSANEELNT